MLLWINRWKDFENRSTSAKVIIKHQVVYFFETQCSMYLLLGWFYNVQILSIASCVTTVCCAFSLCILVVRHDFWRVRPHTIIHIVLSAMLLAAGSQRSHSIIALVSVWRCSLPRDASIRAVGRVVSVRLSVWCLSRSCIVSKRANVFSSHRLAATSLYFFMTNLMAIFHEGRPKRGVEYRWSVKKSRLLTNISFYLGNDTR